GGAEMNSRKLMGRLIGLGFAAAFLAAACAPAATPEQVEVVVTELVEQEVVVTEIVEVEAEEEMESTLERIQREGVVRVGFANENPYAFAKPDGTLSGEAVEVARTIFARMGIEEMEGVLTTFGSLIPGLQAGRFDAITAGMFVNPTRCEQVLFADPEYTIGEALIVAAGNPFDLHSYEDIAANPDVRVGTGTGYFEEQYMLGVGVSSDQISLFPDDPSGMAGLQAGQIDVWTATGPTLSKLLETTGDPGFELADPFTQPIIDGASVAGFGAAAFRRDDLDFRNAFNQELQNLKDEGQLVELIGQFEGFGEHSLPGDTSVSDLCPNEYEGLDLAP
ncbi:MAG: ectoine/hydroxyectoine ABC transporter substrate-binding protein EhuB, partial [Candidatus Methylomirabilales bacterium]